MARSRKTNKASEKTDSSADTPEVVTDTTAATDIESVETDVKVAADDPSDQSAASDEKTDLTSGTKNEDTSADQNKTDDTDRAASDLQDKDVLLDVRDTEADGNDKDAAAGAQNTTADSAEADKPSPAPAPEVARGSIWPGFFGGVIAALVGFVVGRGDVLDQYLPASLQRPSVDLTAIEAKIEQETATMSARSEIQNTQLDTQAARLDALEAVSDASLSDRISALESDAATLNERIDALENRPVASAGDGETSQAVAALETALAEQNAKIDDLAARAEAAEAGAASEARRILARAALTRVETAVDSGEGFSTSLSDLEKVTPVEVPSALREAADAGVPTLASLQHNFPDAARAGLAAARAEVPESEVSGITGFIKRQLNVRSVTPREGSDPDAVLSRAQAAVRAGDLDTALTEMEGLPEAARTAMGDWLAAASSRKAAQDAASELADSLNSN